MKIDLPLFATYQRKTKPNRKLYLNLNQYRNWHHHTSNKAKQDYKETVRELMFDFDKALFHGKTISCLYQIFPATKRRMDLGNVCCIIQKFTEDALVELGYLEDDDYKTIPLVTHTIGEVDKENPRCELSINILGEKND